MTAALLTLLGLGLAGLACWAFYHAGKSDQRAREFNDYVAAGRRADVARDRLRRDAAYARRVRERFTR